MPCDTIRLSTVNLAVADRALLVKALEAMQWTVDLLSASGTIRFRSPQGSGSILADGTITGEEGVVAQVAPRIRQAYAVQCVTAAAQRYGWTLQPKSAQQLVLTRRR